MPHSFELNDKHCQILTPLTSKVRVLTRQQIARTFFNGDSEKQNDMFAMLSELEKAGFLKSYTAMSHPEIRLKGPLCRYQPGQAAPDFGPIASQTRSRWKQPPIETQLVYATSDAKKIFGGYIGGKIPRPSETRHDIHLAQIYLRLAKQEPAKAKAWVSEEQLYEERGKSGGPLPDAIVRIDTPYIVEFGGAYPRQKLEAFHTLQKSQSYEIW